MSSVTISRPSVGAEVDLDRALALVEPGPEEAVAVGGHGPAPAVEPAPDGVEADHVGAELGQRHSAQRGGDECGALDHAQAVEDAPGIYATTATKLQSSTGAGAAAGRSAVTSARRPTSPAGPACSTRSSVRRTSPSNTGPRCSQPSQATMVAIAGIARAACAAAIEIVCPP